MESNESGHYSTTLASGFAKQPFSGGAVTALELCEDLDKLPVFHGAFHKRNSGSEHLGDRDRRRPRSTSGRLTDANRRKAWNEGGENAWHVSWTQWDDLQSPEGKAPGGVANRAERGAEKGPNERKLRRPVTTGNIQSKSASGRKKEGSSRTLKVRPERTDRMGHEQRVAAKLEEYRRDPEKRLELQERANKATRERMVVGADAVEWNKARINERFHPTLAPPKFKGNWEREEELLVRVRRRREMAQEERELEATYSLYRHELAKEHASRRKEAMERQRKVQQQQRALLRACVYASKLAAMADVILDWRTHNLYERSKTRAAILIQRNYRRRLRNLERSRRRDAAITIQRAARKYLFNRLSERKQAFGEALLQVLIRHDRQKRMSAALSRVLNHVRVLQHSLIIARRRERMLTVALCQRWAEEEANPSVSTHHSPGARTEGSQRGGQKRSSISRQSRSKTNKERKTSERKYSESSDARSSASNEAARSLSKDPVVLADSDVTDSTVPWNIKFFVSNLYFKARRRQKAAFVSPLMQSKHPKAHNTTSKPRQQAKARQPGQGRRGNESRRASNQHSACNPNFRLPNGNVLKAIMQEGVQLTRWLRQQRARESLGASKEDFSLHLFERFAKLCPSEQLHLFPPPDTPEQLWPLLEASPSISPWHEGRMSC